MTAADATSLVIDIGKTNIKIHVLDRSHNNLATFNKKNSVFHVYYAVWTCRHYFLFSVTIFYSAPFSESA